MAQPPLGFTGKGYAGQGKIVDRAEAARQKFSDKGIARDVWEGAQRSVKKIEWVKRCPNPMLEDSEIEIRQVA